MERKWCQINTKCWEISMSTIRPPARKISSFYRMFRTIFSSLSSAQLDERKTAIKVCTQEKSFMLIFENVIKLYLVIPSNLFCKGSFWTCPCKWKKCLIITQPSSNINNSELVWKLFFDPDTPNIAKIKSKTIRIGRRTQKIIVHREKSRDKSNHIYLAQLLMVIALEN